MKKYYVVSKVGYEYNDEIYHPTWDGGVIPQLVFEDKQKAENKRKELNTKEFCGINLGSYAYSWDEITSLNFPQIIEKLKEIGIEITEQDEHDALNSLQIPDILHNDKLEKLVTIFNRLKFYQINEVNGE